jgi:hypothetical protein
LKNEEVYLTALLQKPVSKWGSDISLEVTCLMLVR